MYSFTRTFTFDEKVTCKRAWAFTLHRRGTDVVIDDLQITDDKRPDGEIQGCHGHPKTIAVLIKGRNVASIDAATLATASCPRKQSCCQVLAECLRVLRTGETAA